MGKLVITWRGQTNEYLINTQLDDHIIDYVIEKILKHYPQEAEVDFIELWTN